MNTNRKILLRTANWIDRRLVAISTSHSVPELPDELWDRCQTLQRQIQKAECHRWHSAAAILRDRYRSAFRQLLERLREQQSQNSLTDNRERPSSLRRIYEELIALDQEFDSFHVDLEHGILAVTTDPIILEEIDLGPFEVRLSWNQIGERHCYDAVATHPNPASGDSDVTHPHVRGEALCEGDGRVSIERALRDGRLYDFFSIVNRILHTYSPASPYVPLDQWTGVSCADCGSVAEAEEATRCSNCDGDLCFDCRTYCEQCERDFCQSCLGSCSACETALCRECEVRCAGCGKRCCSGCLSESEFCEECQHDPEPESDDSPDDEDECVSDSTTAPETTRAAAEASTTPLTPL